MHLELDRSALDLGRDSERVSADDARRQELTVNRLLRAFTGGEADRCELQLLADEVGLGKTFVALATAYTMLSAVRRLPGTAAIPELDGCYRVALVVTPAGNHALSEKWHRETEALLTRCHRDPASAGWFRGRVCRSADELLQAIERGDDLRRRAPVVLLAEAGVFTKRLADPAVRFFAACLFRWWGNGLPKRERYLLVRGLSETAGSGAWSDAASWEGRGEYEVALWDWNRHERYLGASDAEREQWEPAAERWLFSQVGLTYERVSRALERWLKNVGEIQLELFRVLCKDVPTRRPGDERTSAYREWTGYFQKVKAGLRDIYKELWPYLLKKKLPLVIADEAHHWRHSMRQDCQAFRKFIAPFASRLLLLTATPFQLHRDELIEILKVSDAMEPAIGRHRAVRLEALRGRLTDALLASEQAGLEFSREWGSLGDQMSRADARFSEVACIGAERDSRTEEIGRHWSLLSQGAGRGSPERLQQIPGPLRPFFTRACALIEANSRLEAAMRPLVVRHRRGTAHRRYWVGREYPPQGGAPIRPDQSQLHLAPGAPMPPNAELVQYLLMKVVAEASRGATRTTLGMDLTGCYTTLWRSREGTRAVEQSLKGGAEGLFRLLKSLTGYGRDENPKDKDHPKLQSVVEETLRRWEAGEKSLIFCFRVPTAETLHRLLAEGVDKRLQKARTALFKARGAELGGDFDPDKAMQQFRRSLTAREGSGVPLFLDRVLLGLLVDAGLPIPSVDDDDLRRLATLCARASLAGRPVFSDLQRPDRVFLHRALEHVLSRKVSPRETDGADSAALRDALREMATEDWVTSRYGCPEIENRQASEEAGPEAEHAARSSLAAEYALDREPDPQLIEQLLAAFKTRPSGNRPSLLETLLSGPNLFVPLGAALDQLDADAKGRTRSMRRLLHRISRDGEGWAWPERIKVLNALIRAFLRENVLLRLPRSVFSAGDETWSESLLRGLHARPTSGGLEPLAARVEEFLKELADMGPDERDGHLRYAMNATAKSVVLVTGSSKVDRDAVFSGFNTPLLPEILVCTEVGQEGIDLHRQCRHVIHYDLGWNPASIEQRTGRVDRIGSQAVRERKLARKEWASGSPAEDQLPGLDIALPYLAGTFDERMFDRVRTRAQIFDILTGGDPTADADTGALWLDPDKEGADDGCELVPLPGALLDAIRIDLAVATNAGGLD